MKWKKKLLIQYTPLIRLGGNWGVSFFGSYLGFNFATDLPTTQMLFGSMLTSFVTTAFALCYEARKFKVGKDNG